MNADTAALVSRCEKCRQFAYRQPAEPLILRQVPEQPWQRIGVDLCEYGGRSYLVAYCAYSNYPEVEYLSQTTSKAVVSKLSMMFARHGIPLEVCTDGGAQFTCREFRAFRDKCDFLHTTSSPRFPRSNGLAEKGVQVVKRLLKKSGGVEDDFWVGLLNYRTSPLEDGRTPSELLMGRRLRGRLPDFAVPSASPVHKPPQNLTQGRPLPILHEGDIVRIRQDGCWGPKAQVQCSVAPRSYTVRTEGGQQFRRNRQHLLKTDEPFEPEAVLDEDFAPNEGPPEVTPCPTMPQTPECPQSAATSQEPTVDEPNPTSAVPSSPSPTTPPLRRSTRVRRPPGYLRDYEALPFSREGKMYR